MRHHSRAAEPCHLPPCTEGVLTPAPLPSSEQGQHNPPRACNAQLGKLSHAPFPENRNIVPKSLSCPQTYPHT